MRGRRVEEQRRNGTVSKRQGGRVKKMTTKSRLRRDRQARRVLTCFHFASFGRITYAVPVCVCIRPASSLCWPGLLSLYWRRRTWTPGGAGGSGSNSFGAPWLRHLASSSVVGWQRTESGASGGQRARREVRMRSSVWCSSAGTTMGLELGTGGFLSWNPMSTRPASRCHTLGAVS